MFVLFRAVVFATLFAGFVLVFVPARILSAAGIDAPAEFGLWQAAGMLVGGAGTALAIWCVLTFAFVGKGTPAIFDPPRRLVVSGPYRFVRNPMYIGAGGAITGAALYYKSIGLFGYVALLFVVTTLLVRAYEEPTLRRTFRDDYVAYCARVGRWWPRRGARRATIPPVLR